MKRILGRKLRKTYRTQAGILCVAGVRKLQLMIITVTKIVRMFMMKVNNRYLAIRGMTCVEIGTEGGERTVEIVEISASANMKILGENSPDNELT